jgi:hypothetical protein
MATNPNWHAPLTGAPAYSGPAPGAPGGDPSWRAPMTGAPPYSGPAPAAVTPAAKPAAPALNSEQIPQDTNFLDEIGGFLESLFGGAFGGQQAPAGQTWDALNGWVPSQQAPASAPAAAPAAPTQPAAAPAVEFPKTAPGAPPPLPPKRPAGL